MLEAAKSARSGVVPTLSARVRRTVARGAGAWNKLLLFCGSCRRRLARDCGGAPQLAALQFPGDIAQHDDAASPFILHWPQIFGAGMCHGSLGELTTSAEQASASRPGQTEKCSSAAFAQLRLLQVFQVLLLFACVVHTCLAAGASSVDLGLGDGGFGGSKPLRIRLRV